MAEKTRQTILVTGAGSGLGRDLCMYFAARGYSMVATDIDPNAAVATAELLDRREDHLAIQLDVTDASQIDACMTTLNSRPIHVLINNAGLQHMSPIEEFPPERWDWLLKVMLTGPAMMTRALLPRMREQGYGRIINIGSIHSLVASPYKSAYIAAKHGLVGLTKTVELETADTDITVNTVCPSYIRTPLVEAQIAAQCRLHNLSESEVIHRIMLEPMPKRQFITTEEVAGTIEFLLGPAARNITGQSIAIDGGWTVR